MQFDENSLGEALLELSKLQNDMLNLEADIFLLLAKYSSPCQHLRIDPQQAVVVANSTAVMVGYEYKAEVFLVGCSNESKFAKTSQEVIVNGKSIPIVNGKGIYIAKPKHSGTYKFEGVFRVKIENNVKEYPFAADYQAFQCSDMGR